MTEIIRNRTIRPSSRNPTGSERYTIDTKDVHMSDVLIVNIDHEDGLFNKSFTFPGNQVAHKKSIHFEIFDPHNPESIKWSGAQPNSIE